MYTNFSFKRFGVLVFILIFSVVALSPAPAEAFVHKKIFKAVSNVVSAVASVVTTVVSAVASVAVAAALIVTAPVVAPIATLIGQRDPYRCLLYNNTFQILGAQSACGGPTNSFGTGGLGGIPAVGTGFPGTGGAGTPLPGTGGTGVVGGATPGLPVTSGSVPVVSTPVVPPPPVATEAARNALIAGMTVTQSSVAVGFVSDKLEVTTKIKVHLPALTSAIGFDSPVTLTVIAPADPMKCGTDGASTCFPPDPKNCVTAGNNSCVIKYHFTDPSTKQRTASDAISTAWSESPTLQPGLSKDWDLYVTFNKALGAGTYTFTLRVNGANLPSPVDVKIPITVRSFKPGFQEN